MQKDQEYVLRTVKELDVKFIRLWFTDVLGFLKNFAITPEELEGAFEEGMGFDGSSIEGFTRIQESDMIAKPDPNTFSILPWRPESGAVGKMFCDVYKPDGKPDGDPRYILKRNLKRAADLGYDFLVGPELEYFYFRDDKGTEVLDRGGYFDQTPLDLATDYRRETIFALQKLGVNHKSGRPSSHQKDKRVFLTPVCLQIFRGVSDSVLEGDHKEEDIILRVVMVHEYQHVHNAYAFFREKSRRLQRRWLSGRHLQVLPI